MDERERVVVMTRLAAMAMATTPELAERIDRGLSIALVGGLERLPSGEWMVPSASGPVWYRVAPVGRDCTCPDHAQRGGWCKHLVAVRLTLAVERWETDEAEVDLLLRLTGGGQA